MIQSQYIIAQNNLREPSNVRITYTEVNHTLLLVTMTVTITSHYLKNGKSKEWTGNQARQSLQKNHCSIKMQTTLGSIPNTHLINFLPQEYAEQK